MATTQEGKDLGDTNFPSNEHYLREGLDVIDIGSADSPLSPLVKLCLKLIHIDASMYIYWQKVYISLNLTKCPYREFLCNIRYFFLHYSRSGNKKVHEISIKNHAKM